MGDNEQPVEGLEAREEVLAINQNCDITDSDRNDENRPEVSEKLMSGDRNSVGDAQAEIAGGEKEDEEHGADGAYGSDMREYGNGKEDEREVRDVPASKTGDDGREDVGTGGVVESGGNVAAGTLSEVTEGVDEGEGILEDSDAEEDENDEEEVSVDDKPFSVCKTSGVDKLLTEWWCYAEFGR